MKDLFNAANVRWGSLYSGLYGSDVISNVVSAKETEGLRQKIVGM